MVRKTSPRVAGSPGCRPLFEMYGQAALAQPRRWTDVEPAFLEAMWAFDQNFALGLADQGDNQNGKGDFFTDLIALLLENCSGKQLHGRVRAEDAAHGAAASRDAGLASRDGEPPFPGWRCDLPGGTLRNHRTITRTAG